MKRIERPGRGGTDFQLRHWDDLWGSLTPEEVEAAIRYERILPLACKAFSPGSKLLEAGCGTGKYCLALSRLGYDMTGIDFAPAGLEIMRRMAPELRAVLGSVADMPFATGAFDGALSLGVVEHFEEGPEKPIAELARVIRPGGTLFLTVPYHSLVADWNDLVSPRFTAGDESTTFYQYLFRRQEMAERLLAAGFDIRRVDYLGKALGLSALQLWSNRGMPPPAQTAVGTAPVNNRPKYESPVQWLKNLFKGATPGLAQSLRSAQLRLVETILPGPVCAHLVAYTATRRA